MKKSELRKLINEIAEKKLKEELVKPLATDTTDDSGELPDKQLGNKPNPRLDALQQKKLKLTTRVSDANGVIAKIDQQNMSQKQRAQREKANAEKALEDIEREQGKMQETKTTMKKSELKSLINEYVIETMQENAAQENLKKLVGDTSIEHYFSDLGSKMKDEIVSYDTSNKSLTTKNKLTIKYDDKNETVEVYDREGKYEPISFTRESAEKIEKIFKNGLNIKNIDADYSIPVRGQGNAKSGKKYHADLQQHYKDQSEDPYYDLRARGLVGESKTTMKKSELKALLKVIIQEVVAAKQKRIDETKRLSGLKKSKYSTPATPQKAGNIKEEIIGMIREAISEMSRTNENAKRRPTLDPDTGIFDASVGLDRRKPDPTSPTGYRLIGKFEIRDSLTDKVIQVVPDGTPITAPGKPYEKTSGNPNMGRPKKNAAAPSTIPSTIPSTNVGSDDGEDDSEDDEDETAPETTGGGFNSKIKVVIDGNTIGELDFAKIKGSAAGYLSSMLRGNEFFLKPNKAVNDKLDEFNELYADDKLPTGSTLNLALALDSNSIELV